MTAITKQYTGVGAQNQGALGASANFPGVALQGSRLSIYLSWTGTPTGTFKLQTSVDGTNWIDTPYAAAEFTTQPSGGAGSLLVNYSNVPGSKWRLAYTRSGGSGQLTSWWTMGNA